MKMDGIYSPLTGNIDFLFELDKLRLNVFDAFLYQVLEDVTGIATGDVRITGTRRETLEVPVTQAVVYGWYDNELGSYTNMLSDLTVKVADTIV